MVAGTVWQQEEDFAIQNEMLLILILVQRLCAENRIYETCWQVLKPSVYLSPNKLFLYCRVWRGFSRFIKWGCRGCYLWTGTVQPRLLHPDFWGISKKVLIYMTINFQNMNYVSKSGALVLTLLLWICLCSQENNQYLMYTPFDPLMFVAHKVISSPVSCVGCSEWF